MQRTQISLTDDERRLLDAEGARTGLSMSALIRAAVTKAYGSAGDPDADIHAIDQALGAWVDRDFDGAEYVERLRPGTRLTEASQR